LSTEKQSMRSAGWNSESAAIRRPAFVSARSTSLPQLGERYQPFLVGSNQAFASLSIRAYSLRSSSSHLRSGSATRGLLAAIDLRLDQFVDRPAAG
jgi:hypothetical protein